jgi:molecular chaperone HtpG
MADTPNTETFGFQAEVKQLLHLVVHSLYSNPEIFLRELISNASDANDKLRFAALADQTLMATDTELTVRVEVDAARHEISVIDNGIGMSREEIIEQLGTIAHSGTGAFLAQLTGDQKEDSRLIGQFGVGFYSAFVVAEEVEVVSRKAGLPPSSGVRWISDGRGEYRLAAAQTEQRGTRVTLRLKPEAFEFLDPARIRALVHRYADHIAFPVTLSVAADPRAAETINRAKALWTRPRAEITDEEYIEFYKHSAHDATDPLAWAHNRVEGKREYTSLLYIPSIAPLGIGNRETPKGVKLYVQRVFITEDATQFLPLYMRFVRGVLDASDLPLNISRELLQQDPSVGVIKSSLTKRVLDLLDELAADQPDKYRTFWQQFGSVFKEGLVEDAANQNRVAGLLRFNTTRSQGPEDLRSLEQYVAEAADADSPIYYLTAASLAAANAVPHLEVFRARNIEVLLLVERIDEWVIQSLGEYKGKAFRDIARGALELEPKAEGQGPAGALDKEARHLLKRIKRVLRERVAEVRASERLTESAACLVLGEDDLGHQMRELLQAAGHAAPQGTPSLEVNLHHPLLQRLQRESDEPRFEQLALLVLDQATLTEGRALENPGAFVKRLNALLLELGGPSGSSGQTVAEQMGRDQ